MKRRKILLLFLGFLAFLVVGTYVVLVYTGASRTLVESVMARFIRSRFDLRNAEVDPATGKVRLEGVHIGHPTLNETDVLVAGHVELDVNTNPLGADEMGKVRRVKVEKLHLHLSFTDVDQWDLMEILELPESGRADSYPAVTVTDSKVTVRLTEDRPAVEFSNVHLDLLPESEGSAHMVLSGSMTTPAGFEVKVRGSGDLGKGEFHALFETVNLPLEPEIARPYSPAAHAYLTDAGLSGIAKKVALWVQYPAEPGDDNEVSARLSAEVEGVAWTLRDFPYPVTDAAGRVTASTREGGAVQFDLLSRDQARTVRTRAELTRCLSGAPLIDVLVKAAGVPVDDRLRAAVDTVPYAKTSWEAFEPTGGVVDADIFLHNREPGGTPLLSMDLSIAGVAGRFLGFPPSEGERRLAFPYQIEDVSGLIQIRPGAVSLRNVTGGRADGARVRLHGTFTGLDRGDGVQHMALDVEGESVVFSDELSAALESLYEGGSAIYASYAPEGKGDVDIRLRKRAGEPQPRFHVEIRPLRGAATYDRFPYRLTDLQGNIQIATSGVGFDLTGQRGDSPVELGGRFLFGVPEGAPEFELWLHGRSIVLDPQLRAALKVANPDLDPFWGDLMPTGTVDCQMTLWKAAGAETFEHDVRLDFHRGSAEVRRFERTLQNLRGSVFVHGSGVHNRMDISILRAEVDNGDEAVPAQVVLEGSVQVDETSNAMDLTTIVRGLQLNQRFAATLDRARIVSQSTWDVLVPAGVVDVVTHHRKSFDQIAVAHRLLLQLHDVSTNARVLPRPVTGLQGEVRITEDRGQFDEIRGRLGEADVSGGGSFRHEKDQTIVDVTLHADHVPVDSRFAKLMTGPIRKVFLDRNVRGAVGVNGLKLIYRFPDRGEEFEAEFEGEVIAKHMSMTMVVQVQEINGSFDLQQGELSSEGGKVLSIARDVSFRVLGHHATHCSAEIFTNASEIRVRDIEMELHGGTVQADGPDGHSLLYDVQQQELSAQMRWDDMSLTQFMRAAGETAPISRGTLSGRLDLERLTGDRVVDITAEAELQVLNGKLGEVPIFTAIYAFLEPTNRPQFDSLRVKMKVADQNMTIDDLILTSPLIEVRGGGTIGMDGYLDIVLEFPDFFARAGSWLILPQILRVITSQVVRFHVFGYLRSPRARPRWLFQTDPNRLRIEPIPARIQRSPKKRF